MYVFNYISSFWENEKPNCVFRPYKYSWCFRRREFRLFICESAIMCGIMTGILNCDQEQIPQEVKQNSGEIRYNLLMITYHNIPVCMEL